MRNIIWAILLTALTACQPHQPENKMAQQQHFICKSLIEGFLKMQHLGQYTLKNIQPTLHEATTQRLYTFQVSSDINMRINMPRQQNLQFQCLQNPEQHFQLTLVGYTPADSQPLMSLELPPRKTIDTLTTFVLKTQ
ncbi:hypothetical protein [Acinetobacter sp. WZC-1]|uniref:hypothetical protein n=1 Tax=Acinetobacter sp. WZC-1 TaxID=3459034 RepID=UPI00403DFBF8